MRSPTQRTARPKAAQFAGAEGNKGVKSKTAMGYFLHSIKVKYARNLELYFFLLMKGLK